MKQLSFKNRIAFNYIISTGLLTFVVFFVIYSTVRFSVYKDVKEEIRKEIALHLKEMKFNTSKVIWIDSEEWEEIEHNEVSVNPVFVQIKDVNGKTVEKSPNLKTHELDFEMGNDKMFFKQTSLDNQLIQLSQTPIILDGQTKGYLLIGMSLEHPVMLLENLQMILFLLYPLVLIVLFFIARIIAGRSIRPINTIIETSNLITRDNLNYRVDLPKNKDELHQLSVNINSLLDRIESAVEREKQFTSDASHELRTPLAVIKGTLEVLIRKPRNKEEYEEKISFCITEVDRLNILVDELLLLARFENQKQEIKEETVYLNGLLLEILSRYSEKIESRAIHIETDFSSDHYITSDSNMVSIILTNLISNAVKYCNERGTISIRLHKNDEKSEFEISNTGKGISKEDITKVFNPFYRSAEAISNEIKGVGLGMSIIKRLCDLLKIEIAIQSEENQKTEVRLKFR